MEKHDTCRICGRPAKGIQYFTVLACLGCKAFYRRSVKRRISYVCYAGNCPTHADSRVRCKACRFRRCAELGLKTRDQIRHLKKEASFSLASPNRSPAWFASGTENFGAHSNRRYAQNAVGSLGSNPVSRCSTASLAGSSDHELCDPPLLHPWRNADSTIDDEFMLSGMQILQDISACFPDHSPGSEDWQVAENSLLSWRRLSVSPELDNDHEFLPFGRQDAGILEPNRRQIFTTVHAVGLAAQAIFGDQILNWTMNKDSCLNLNYCNQPDTFLNTMVVAVNQHNKDNVQRVVQFASQLPGMNQLERSARCCLAAGWKFLVFWVIHHAEFMSNTETFITVGPKQLHYRRFWQEAISETALVNFTYKFCNEFREIGLSQTERYLLMAVVIFEPGEDYLSHQSMQLRVIHRHYTDTLMDVLKRRCSDSAEFAQLLRKLERFFSLFKSVYQLHQEYLRYRCPRDMVDAKAQVIQLQIDATAVSYPAFHPGHPIIYCSEYCTNDAHNHSCIPCIDLQI